MSDSKSSEQKALCSIEEKKRRQNSGVSTDDHQIAEPKCGLCGGRRRGIPAAMKLLIPLRRHLIFLQQLSMSRLTEHVVYYFLGFLLELPMFENINY